MHSIYFQHIRNIRDDCSNNGTLCARRQKKSVFFLTGYQNTHLHSKEQKKKPRKQQLYCILPLSSQILSYRERKCPKRRYFHSWIRNWFLIVGLANRNSMKKLMTQQRWQQPANSKYMHALLFLLLLVRVSHEKKTDNAINSTQKKCLHGTHFQNNSEIYVFASTRLHCITLNAAVKWKCLMFIYHKKAFAY